MTHEEARTLFARINQINAEFARLTPEFLKAGGSQEKARADAKEWSALFAPLFEEHAKIAARLKAHIAGEDNA